MSSYSFDSFNFQGGIKTIQPVYIDSPQQQGIPVNVDGVSYIPASTIRGSLRRSAHNVLSMYLASKGTLLDLETHFALAIGYDLNNKAKRSAINSEFGYHSQQIRSKNAFISLFGRWMLASRLGVGNGFATTKNALTKTGPKYLKNIFESSPDLISLLTVPDIESLEAILMSSSKNFKGDTLEVAELQKKIKDYQKKLELNEVPVMKNMLKSQISLFESELESVLRTKKIKKISKEIESISMFKAGIEFNHTMNIKNSSVYEFHTLLFSIYALSLSPYLGAKYGTGMGQIEGTWDIYKNNIFKTGSDLVGKVGFNSDGFYSEIYDEQFQLNGNLNFEPMDFYNLIDSKLIDLNVLF